MLATARGPLVTAMLVLSAVDAAAQSTTYNAERLRDLPSGGSLFSLLETAQPEVVTDRFNSGGLNVGEGSRLSGLLASWGQARVRVGDIDISSAVDGTPLIFPSIAWWSRVDVGMAGMAVDDPAAGLSVVLHPIRPTLAWSGRAAITASGGPLTASARPGTAPPIARLDHATAANALASGMITDRVGLVAGAEFARSAVVAREASEAGRRSRASIFGVATIASDTGGQLHALAVLQRAAGHVAAHVQASFADGAPQERWRFYSGYTRAARSPAHRLEGAVERLTDGPVHALASHRPRTEHLWTAGARAAVAPLSRRHVVTLAFEIAASSVSETPFAGTLHETVDGIPARIWTFAAGAPESRRRTWSTSAAVRDRFAISNRTALDLGARVEHVRGRARGAMPGVSWLSVLPAVVLRHELGTPLHFTFVTSARRTGHRLLLGPLAAGDPASPTADVYRWEPSSAGRGPLVARTGPGAGDAGLVTIDADLRRPTIDEFTIGLEARPRDGMRLIATGIAQRQRDVIQLVNTGVTSDSYELRTVPDANADLVKADDDQQLAVYDRVPSSFGQDRYLLTNPAQDAAVMGAIVLGVHVTIARLALAVGATAAAAVGAGANRGFRAIENDLDVLGEVFTNPNAATYARGRLFNDRAYTVKSSLVYRFPRQIRVGVLARYQDGQPFTRLVVIPDLRQGAEAVQAFARGRSRFAFTGTLDLRLQKGVRLGTTAVDLLFDVYNLPNMRKETEEYVVTGPRFRQTTAVQPPASVHAGVRVTF